MSHDQVIDLYERHAAHFDRERSRRLDERDWLDRFLAYVPEGGTVLDIGCGMGEPIARYLVASGRRLTGVDSSRSMIDMARRRLPDSEWIVADMRQLALERRFDGVVAWDSFFHLSPSDQRAMFPRFAAHANAGAPLLFTSGPAFGEVVGSFCGEALYHASLDGSQYRELLERNGFTVRDHRIEDPQCGGHTVWLATYNGPVNEATR